MFGMTEQTLQFLLNNGVAVMVVVALLAGFYLLGKALIAGAKHLFEHVAIPMKDAAIQHLDNTSKYLEKSSQAIESLQCTLEKIDRKLPPPKTDP